MTDVDSKFNDVRESVADRASRGECVIPPRGWRCTRGVHDDGPCAAVPTFDSLTRLKMSGRPEDPETIKIHAVRGDAVMPLDVEAIAFELDVHGGRVSLSWHANVVDLDIDIRPLSTDERVDQLKAMLADAVAEIQEHHAEYHHRSDAKLEEWKWWLQLHELGRR